MKFFVCISILLTTAFAGAQTPAKKTTFNPDIGLNTLFLYHAGLSLNETELIFSSDVDAYAKLFSTLALHKENGEWKIEPEEIYAESLGLTSITLKTGKFYAALGKANGLHKHAYPFINQNLTNIELFGDEGINSTGLGASYLLPTTWFLELTAQALTARDVSFFANTNPDAFGVVKLRNLFDLTDSLTMDLGLSAATGANDNDKTSTVGVADLTFKWRPVEGGKYSALIWSSEYMNGSKRGNPTSSQPLDICTQGGSSYLQWQFAQRWWLQGRTEYLDQKIGANYTVKKRQSALLGFMPTEFSGLRLQYDYFQDSQLTSPDHTIMFQVNLSIGAHPAHSY